MIKNWIEAMRLRTLPVSVAGVIAGCGCAIMLDSFKAAPAAYIVLHILAWNKLKKARGAALNPILGKTALNLLIFAVMFLLLTF